MIYKRKIKNKVQRCQYCRIIHIWYWNEKLKYSDRKEKHDLLSREKSMLNIWTWNVKRILISSSGKWKSTLTCLSRAYHLKTSEMYLFSEFLPRHERTILCSLEPASCSTLSRLVLWLTPSAFYPQPIPMVYRESHIPAPPRPASSLSSQAWSGTWVLPLVL